MKFAILSAIILLFAPHKSTGQTIFRMVMDVAEASPSGSDCFNDIDVTWGVSGDTIAFMYNTKVVKFWKVALSHPQKAALDKLNRSKTGDYTFVSNYWGEAWLIRMVSGKGGVIIFLNEIHSRSRYLLFDYTDTGICN
jgi:hypothetical protein